MPRIRRYRPASDTVIGLIAVIVATAWSVSVIHATSAGDASYAAPAPLKANLTYVEGPTESLDHPFVDFANADCPSGETVLSGGLWTNNAHVRLVESAPTDDHRGWKTYISNQLPFETVDAKFAAYAICAKPGVPVVAPQ